MAIIKYKDPQTGEYKTVVGVVVKNKVVQTTGQSTTDVMSQKAVSDLVPAQASSSNQLADKDFVNSSITTATATYQGSYNLVSDLSLTTQASHGQIEDALGTAISGADNNDYAFVQIPTADATPTEIASVERYKFNGTRWSYEYAINNSGFTAAQWAAVNSGITSGLVAKLGQLTGNTYSAQNGLAGLFGFDNNGAWQNIVPSDLASVLSVPPVTLYSSSIAAHSSFTLNLAQRYSVIVCIDGSSGDTMLYLSGAGKVQKVSTTATSDSITISSNGSNSLLVSNSASDQHACTIKAFYISA